MLNSLQDNCTSYDNGRCGLHVHVNREALNIRDWHKVEWFFWKCKAYITKFSKRTKEQIKQWTEFSEPAEASDILHDRPIQHSIRYRAVNFTTNTVEFRIFRGTLNPMRFWASLCFVAALIDFIQLVGVSYIVLRSRVDIWREFVNWTKRDYKFLYDGTVAK